MIRLRNWGYYDYDEMSWLCELWDHVKGMMIQVWIWITCVPYYDMTMICWSHKLRIFMKGNSCELYNEIMTWLCKG